LKFSSYDFEDVNIFSMPGKVKRAASQYKLAAHEVYHQSDIGYMRPDLLAVVDPSPTTLQ